MPRPIIYPDFSMVETSINDALHLLYRNDHFLIINSTSERSITHKLAEYIQQLFPQWHVDCEYNRLGLGFPKNLPDQHTSYPDIIIHKRNTKTNLLVIEAKSIHSADRSDTHDKEKIKAYIEDPEYQYRFGLWLCFYDEFPRLVMDWFENRDRQCLKVNHE